MYEKGLLWLVIIILILLTLIIWIVIKQFFRMLFSNILEEQLKSIKKVKWYESLPQFILLLIALYFSINPPEYLLSFIQQGILP
jgi:formate hydrogenlyase subunit 3/multisubunit Na+/H+ antiporter MnhD subunit